VTEQSGGPQLDGSPPPAGTFCGIKKTTGSVSKGETHGHSEPTQTKRRCQALLSADYAFFARAPGCSVRSLARSIREARSCF